MLMMSNHLCGKCVSLLITYNTEVKFWLYAHRLLSWHIGYFLCYSGTETNNVSILLNDSQDELVVC